MDPLLSSIGGLPTLRTVDRQTQARLAGLIRELGFGRTAPRWKRNSTQSPADVLLVEKIVDLGSEILFVVAPLRPEDFLEEIVDKKPFACVHSPAISAQISETD